MRPLIIDVEASGFGRGSYPIEVGVALADGQTECVLIKPLDEWQHWDPQAEQLHTIPRDALFQHGKPVVEVALWLNDLIGGETVYSDAWGNDSSWLALLFECAQLPQRFKVEPLYGLLSEQQVETWHETKDIVIKNYGFTRHRASHDALILQESFCYTDINPILSKAV